MNLVTNLIAGAIAPIANIFVKKEERKKATAIIKAETIKGTKEGETAVTLTNAQWDLVSKQNETDTWKDEYITLLITSPLVCILLGNIIAVVFGSTALLEANTASLLQLQDMGIDMGELMLYTVLAALGLKVLK